jgi:hypothetical protein
MFQIEPAAFILKWWATRDILAPLSEIDKLSQD